MPKKAMSVTLDETNVLWLRARARMKPGNNVSEELDRLITAARFGKGGAPPEARSVVGMVDLSDDPNLEKADAALRELFDEWLANNASLMNEDSPEYAKSTRKKKRG
jgi:hypothetical protein